MKRIIPNISVENCKEALDFYREIFGGEIRNVQIAEANEMFKGHEGKIVHSELHINTNCILYLTDIMEENTAHTNISLILDFESNQEIGRAYSSLSKNGRIIFELQKTFWGAYHAVLVDQYGVKWSLNYSE